MSAPLNTPEGAALEARFPAVIQALLRQLEQIATENGADRPEATAHGAIKGAKAASLQRSLDALYASVSGQAIEERRRREGFENDLLGLGEPFLADFDAWPEP